MKYIRQILILLFTVTVAFAQPERYSDVFLGLPQFKALPVKLPYAHADSVQLEVHVLILNDDLQFVKNEGRYEAAYTVDATIKTRGDRLIETIHLNRELSAETYVETNSRVRNDQTRFLFTLVPGKYELRIDLMDRESRKSRVLEKNFEFSEEEWGDPLKLSDIVLIDSTGSAHMSYRMIQGKPINAAYKLYCEHPEDASLVYQLRNDNDEITFSGELPLQGKGTFFADTLSFPTDSLRDSNYRLFILAQNDDNSLMRSYPFDLLLHNLPSYISNLEMAIMQTKYVATDDEFRVLKRAHSSKREQLFRTFWKEKDPTPTTPTNEKMEEYYRRVDYANEHFDGYRGGWESDMGHVYIVYGTPTDIERHPFEPNTRPYEIWFYYDINRKFIFQDREGFGEYRLVSSFWDGY